MALTPKPDVVPQVSVIMPMRNASAFVEEALASVIQERQIALEVIVIDDGSTDNSRQLVEAAQDPRVRILDGPQRGVAACLNLGVSNARGSIIMRCDADDIYPADRISQQAIWLQQFPQHDAVCGGYQSIDVKGQAVALLGVAGVRQTEDIEAELRTGVTRTSLCTFAMRTSAVVRTGGFREFFETSSDIDFQLRLGEVCRIGFVPRVTYLYRLHDSSITHSQARLRREFFEVTARKFQLQRLQRGSDDLQDGYPPLPPDAAGAAPSAASQQIQGMLIGQAWRHFQAGHHRQAISTAWRAVRTRPSNLASWQALSILILRSARRQLF